MKHILPYLNNSRTSLKNLFYAILGIVIVVGTLLRFTNLNWDSYQAFHPDERNISWAVTRIRFFDQMNPKFFAYGGLPIYLYRAIGEVVVKATHDDSWLFEWGKIAVLGRYVSAILSSISILLIYVVAVNYFSKAVGLLSAFLLAFSPWAIREAHFATTETMLVFYLLLLLILAYRFFMKPKITQILLMGLIFGLALASKTTGFLFLVIPFSAFLLNCFEKKHSKKRLFKSIYFLILHLSIFTVTSLLTASIFSLYTILDWPHFAESMRYETGVALGRFSVPYTLQFAKTIPYLYQFITLIWQSGAIAPFGLLGLILLLTKTFKSKSKLLIIFLVFPLIYYFYQGSWYAKFSRYNVPFLPFITIAAAWLMTRIWFFSHKSSRFLFIGRICVLVGLVGFHMWWGLANWSIYLRPQTRVQASRWIYKFVPEDTLIFTEHWNDGLPVKVEGTKNISYNRELLNVYDADNEEKLKTFTQMLAKGSFVILSSRRMWTVLPYLPDKYPMTSRFYKKLFTGELGYQEVANFSSYPRLFGMEINDDSAEESVQVFDHPTIKIFRNTGKLKIEEMEERLRN